MDHGICEIHGGGYKRSCTKCELEAADKEIKRLRHEADGLVVQRTMAVARLGGEVEGAPTHAGNFLQRIDALRDIEEAAWRMANIWDRATMENDSREIAKAMGLANYLAMFDAWSAVEAALAPRSERREGEPGCRECHGTGLNRRTGWPDEPCPACAPPAAPKEEAP